jgi:hypothetical protein
MTKKTQGDKLDEARHQLSVTADRIGGETLATWRMVRTFIVGAIDSSRAKTGNPGLPDREEAFRLIAEELASGRDPHAIAFRRGLSVHFHTSIKQAGRWVSQYERQCGHKY